MLLIWSCSDYYYQVDSQYLLNDRGLKIDRIFIDALDHHDHHFQQYFDQFDVIAFLPIFLIQEPKFHHEFIII